MKKKIILTLLAISGFTIYAQSFKWVKQFGGTGHTYSNVIIADNKGNSYTGGRFNVETDLDPGPGTYTLSTLSAANAYITKLDDQGNLIWAKSFGNDVTGTGYTSNANISSMAVDTSGNIYITGGFVGKLDFDPGPGTYTLSSFDSLNYPDVFIMKLNTSGNFVWAKKIGGAASDAGNALSLDASNNVIITGYNSHTIDFDPGPGTSNLNLGTFFLKLSNSGTFIWAKSIGISGLANDMSDKLLADVDALGNIYYSGTFSGTFDFDPGPGSYNLTSSNGTNAFILKLNALGDFVWAKCPERSSNSGVVDCISMAFDNLENIYVTGYYSGTVDFDSGPGVNNLTATVGTGPKVDVFVLKLDNQGNFKWAKGFGGSDDDIGLAIATDVLGGVYITGVFKQTVDFDPGAGTLSLNSNGGNDIFISKLDALGNFSGAKSIGNMGTDYVWDLAVDKDRDIYLTGDFYNTVDFDPDAGVYNLTTFSGFANDTYVLKLDHGALGINENVNESTFLNAYPNPAQSNFRIKSEENVQLDLINCVGNKVQTLYLKKDTMQEVDIENLLPGIYFLTGQTSKGAINRKIVVTN